MSIFLGSPGTRPAPMQVKTLGVLIKTEAEPTEVVIFGENDVAMMDFCTAVLYVLTNTDLRPDDPRLKLLERINSMEQVSVNEGAMRLQAKGQMTSLRPWAVEEVEIPSE